MHDPTSPSASPEGFGATYTTVPGDTLFYIAQSYNVSLQSLLAANPHIRNPTQVSPGDPLRVPAPPPPLEPSARARGRSHPLPALPPRLPACFALRPMRGLPRGISGSVTVWREHPGGQGGAAGATAIIIARLPEPSSWGPYTTYMAGVQLGRDEESAPMHAVVAAPRGTWLAALELPLGLVLLPDLRFEIRPAKPEGGTPVEPVLFGTLPARQ